MGSSELLPSSSSPHQNNGSANVGEKISPNRKKKEEREKNKALKK